MPVNTKFIPITSLTAGQLNQSFGQAANIAGDNFTGNMSVKGVDILSGLLATSNIANSALHYSSNASFIAANNAANTANLAIVTANNASNIALFASVQANNSGNVAISANNLATNAYSLASASYNQANTNNIAIGYAFIQANQSYALASNAFPITGGNVSGNLVVLGSTTSSGNIVHQSYNTSLPGNNYTIALASNVSEYHVTGTGVIGKLTLMMPPNPSDGQYVVVRTQQPILQLVVQDSTGSAANVITAPNTLGAGGYFSTQYTQLGQQWWCFVTADFAQAKANNLYTPNITIPMPTLKLDTTGTHNYGAIINNFIQNTINQGRNGIYLAEGAVLIETSVIHPGNFDIVGLGKLDKYSGAITAEPTGVKLIQPNLSRIPIMTATGMDLGNSNANMIKNVGIRNICFIAEMNGASATYGANGTITYAVTASITNGSKLLVISGSTPFSSNSLGSIIYVAGAGVGGANLVAYITIVNTSAEVTLSVAANTTLSSTATTITMLPILGGTAPSGSNYTSGGPGTLLSVYSAYLMTLENLVFQGYYARHALFSNVWDSSAIDITSWSGGFSDPTQTQDSFALQQYTGRLWTPTENLFGRSWGVPAIEIVSPDYFNGPDTTNIFRIKAHIEGSTNNQVGCLIRGPNGTVITFMEGSKIELDQGAQPLMVAENQNRLSYTGWMNGGGTGSAPAGFGGVTTGYAWNQNPNPGQVVLYQCYSPTFKGSIGYAGAGSSANLAAYYNIIQTDNPHIEVNVTQGLDSLSNGAARVILNACTNVDDVHVKAAPYVLAIPKAVQQEVLLANNTITSQLGQQHIKFNRRITGTSNTDIPTADDRGGTILSAGSVAVTATINDLGPGIEYSYIQTSSSGVVTVVANTGTTLTPTTGNFTTLGVGSRLLLECHGDGTVSVYTLLSSVPGAPTQNVVYQGAQSGNFSPVSGASRYLVRMWGAAGGGGGGGIANNGQLISGGGGGAAGGYNEFWLSPSQMGAANVSFSIGANGAGGIAATTANTNGGNGGQGGPTHFGLFSQFGYLSYVGGGGGGAGGQIGTTSGGGGSSSPGSTTSGVSATGAAGAIGTGLGLTGGTGAGGGSSQSLFVGGAGGGCSTTGIGFPGGSSFGAGGGGAGGGVSSANTAFTGGTGGQGGGNAVSNPGTAISPNGINSNPLLIDVPGSGGGGGFGAIGANTAGNGGSGSNGSGGGGGGSLQAFANGVFGIAGAGGPGGLGSIQVIIFF